MHCHYGFEKDNPFHAYPYKSSYMFGQLYEDNFLEKYQIVS